MTPIFAFLTPMTIAVLAIVGVILFGRRLPEIGKSLGKTIVEFKKGMHGLEDDMDLGVGSKPAAPPQSAPSDAIQPVRPPQRVAATAPKFEDAPTSSAPQA
jgi:sec-independent protein translocase protein TatA